MKKQLTPTQMLWMFGVFALLAFILASYTFLSFRQAFRMNSEVPALPEDEITSKPTLLEHGVNVTKTGGAKVVVSEELADVLEEEARDEQSSMVGNTPIVLNTVHQPEEKVPAQPVGNVQSVKESHDKVDIVKPADNGTQNEGTLPSDENRSSKPLTSMFVQRQAPVILTANATPATSLPSPGGDGYEKFPECREYFVNSKHTELKELYEKIDSLTSLAAFYDKDETKFNLQQPKDVKYIQYNMIVWDGLINIKKAGTYIFFLTWVVPFVNEHGTEGSIGLQVKDKMVLIGPTRAGNTCQGQFDIELKTGMNRLRLCILTRDNMNQLKSNSPIIRYKPKNAIGEFRELTPTNLYHIVQEVDW